MKLGDLIHFENAVQMCSKKKQITCVDCSEIYNCKQHIILILKELECKNINKNIISLENRTVL